MPINFPNKPGIIAYLTAGDPSLAATRDIALSGLDNGTGIKMGLTGATNEEA